MKKIFIKSIYTFFFLGVFVTMFSCDDLEENLNDVLTENTQFTTDAEFQAILASSYNTLNEYSFWYLMVIENYSDNLTIYTHTSGWNNDRHRRTDTHNLSPADNLRFPLGTVWNPIFNGIARTNATIATLNNVDDSSPFKADFLSQARVIRAYHYFLGMDAYGGMPIVEKAAPEFDQPLPSRSSTAEVFQFIESELLAAIDGLPSGRNLANPTVITKESARAVLATLYLNAEVYTGTSRWQDCITQCDAILGASGYALAPNYFDLFKVNNASLAPEEMLLFIDFTPGVSPGGGIGFVRAGLTQEWVTDRYPNFPFNIWNGPAVQPTFYRRYDDNDMRKTDGFLEGVQTSITTGTPLVDNNGLVVDHTIDFYLQPSDTQDGSGYVGKFEGVRSIKWEPDPNAVSNQQGNGIPFIRLGDIVLQKAECLIRLNGPNAESDALINQIRARVFDPDQPLTDATLDDVYNERGFELFAEGHRRRDQIRFGTLNEADDFHPAHDASFNLFPIPQDQLDANPNLGQNPGY